MMDLPIRQGDDRLELQAEAAFLDNRAGRLDARVGRRDEADQAFAKAEPRRGLQPTVTKAAEREA